MDNDKVTQEKIAITLKLLAEKEKETAKYKDQASVELAKQFAEAARNLSEFTKDSADRRRLIVEWADLKLQYTKALTARVPIKKQIDDAYFARNAKEREIQRAAHAAGLSTVGLDLAATEYANYMMRQEQEKKEAPDKPMPGANASLPFHFSMVRKVEL